MSNGKKSKLRIPKLKVWQRIILYILMIVSAVLALVNVATESFSFAWGIVFYVVAALTLFTGIYYLVFDIRDGVKSVKGFIDPKIEANPYTNRVIHDKQLKTVLSSVPHLITGVLFAGFNGVLGIAYSSPWLGSMSAYYLILTIMRIGAVRQHQIISKINEETTRFKKEDAIYRRNSRMFILMAFVLGGIVVLLVHSIGGKTYGEYTIFVVAANTFYKLIMAFINMAKDRKSDSPLVTIILKVDFIDSLVSLLMLQTAMFAAFGEGDIQLQNTLNLCTGITVCIMMLFAGAQGMVVSAKRRKAWKMEV